MHHACGPQAPFATAYSCPCRQRRQGFAVVANEVRNLAVKSAEAAKQTTALIQTSVATVARGTEISNQTAQTLQDVGTRAAEVTDSFAKIEHSISQQAVAIEQIKDGLSQISAVVQTNAATAEENSATSEDMSAQAVTLQEEVAKFKLAGEGAQESGPAAALSSERPSKKALTQSAVSFGTY